MKKAIVCHGALCKCQFGTAPDKLVVLTQNKIYVNDKKSSEKLVATTMELGPTFENKTFGTCTNTNSACVPNIIEWDGFYDKVTLPNKGNPLLEDSKGTCAIAGLPCVEILFHGQIASPTQKQADKTNEEIHSQLNPLARPSGPIEEEAVHNLYIS
ncbi:DUF4280 domain-containing protein [Zobellia uliginosa]|uniref:DUF4280 domain-containing protein n=1 Tax=Zobellia uliginosa TaxID=143224 RepID=UPI0026E28F3F|nr:DUF4280 domain-containing protein [Zobellia uliginosa]MDO6519048.1 DUF4280 domain-containing protein [Zobellia uliginosa]